MNYLTNVKINATMPCLADPEKIRFIALTDKGIAEMLPLINAVVKGAIYNKEGNTLTLKKEGRIISFHPTKIAGAKILDVKDAQDTLQWVVDLINDCYEKRDSITPDYTRREKLGILDLYKLLPGTNCRACGMATCLAFATALSQESKDLKDCKEIFKNEYNSKQELLINLLKDAGYEINGKEATKWHGWKDIQEKR